MIFHVSKFPSEEQTHVRHVDSSLFNLRHHADTFAAAVNLRIFCVQNLTALPAPLPIQWMAIAGRDGAMTLYHFDETMDGIVSSLDLVPTLMANIDHKNLRIYRKLFNSFFPGFENIRHAVAHRAELTRDRRSFERNAFTGKLSGRVIQAADGVSNLMMTDCFDGDKFTTTHEGQLLTYELNAKSHEKIVRVCERFIGAFTSLRDPSLMTQFPGR
jgi:hypothetical protein